MANGDKTLGHILTSWEKARNESEKTVADTLFWILFTTGQDPHGRPSTEFVTVSDAIDAMYAGEHAAIVVACRQLK